MALTVIAIFLAFLLPLASRGQIIPPKVVITEIASFLPKEEEWVEIHNTSDVIADVSAWRFVEGFTVSDSDGARHKLTPFIGDSRLDAREYAVIANNAAVFLEKHSSFSGTLFDSAWSSLKESGEKVQLIDGNSVVAEEFTYFGGDGILARKDPLRADYSPANWAVVHGIGTPGAPYDAFQPVLQPAAPPSAISAPSPSLPQQPQEPTNAVLFEPPTANAGSSVAARVQEVITFDGSRSYDPNGTALSYRWDFGDGERAAGAIVTHAFAREGDYRARLTVSTSAGSDSDDVRVTVVGEESEPRVSFNDEQKALTPSEAAVLPSRVEVMMEGIVTVEPGIFAKTYFYISSNDGRNGLQVYASDGKFPDLHIGQLIEVTGKMSSYYGLKRIIIGSPGAIAVMRGADPPPAEEVAVSRLNDAHLGRLVTIVGKVVKEDGKVLIAGDGGAGVRAEVKPETGISKTDLQEGATISLTGIVDKTRSGLRLIPRYPGDIVVIVRADTDTPGKNRVLGEKAETPFSEIEYAPASNVLDYTTEARSRSPVLKYLIATAAALVFVLIGIFMRERSVS